jgi:hypothetical protein
MAEQTTFARFALWIVPGAVIGLVTLVFGAPALLVLLLGAVLAGTRPHAGTSLGGYLAGVALPVGWVGVTIGAVDRVCTEAVVDVGGVEQCLRWEQSGSIRWPWFVAAGLLLGVGVLLQVAARRRERPTWGAPSAVAA